MTAKTYAILNYGCQMNESDAEHYAGQLQELGYKAAEDFHDADVVVVNTCCVRESAEKRILGKIGELKGVKANHPGQIVCVAGCMAQKDGEKLIKKHPQIDLLIGTAHVNGFKEILAEYLSEKGERVYNSLEVKESEFEGERIRQSGFSAWIPIMYGCNNFCSYCIVPYVRGRERSRMFEDVLAEARGLVARGYKEIMLLGQNVNSYRGEAGQGFPELLRRLNEIEGEFRVRFMTSHPKDATHELIDAIADCEKVCSHLHLPVQSGSNRILQDMNRRYTVEDYCRLIDYAKSRIPGLALTSDIIVGFPTERYEDVKMTIDLIRRVRYHNLYTFIYSKRVGTKAAELDDPVPYKEKSQWFTELLQVQTAIGDELYHSYIGKKLRVLVDSVGKSADGMVSGRSEQNIIVDFKGDQSLIGSFVDVKITGAAHTALVGEKI